MDNIDNLKNGIVEKASKEANEALSQSVEATKSELNEKIETKADASSVEELKAENVTLQKELDDVKTQVKSFNINKMAKATNEFNEMLREKANEIANLKQGDTVTLELKDWGNNADGVASAPYGDERVTPIKYDPNFANRVRNHITTGSTSQSGGIRHTFETAETDSSAAKAKGAEATQSSITLTDVHTPIRTLFNVLTLPQEQLDDIAMVESFLSTRLMGNLMDLEDVQLLRGAGTGQQYSGLATGSRAFADAAAREAYVGPLADRFGTGANEYDVITAIAAGMANENYTAGICFLNPLDYYSMVTRKTTDNRYTLQTTVAPNGEYKTIWNGIELVKTAAQTAGTFTVIDKMATQYWMREGASIEFGMNANDFASNNISVKAIIRGALTNYNQRGIVSDTFANFEAALNA